MPDTAVMAQVERRLLELGCPRRWLREKARELADHHDDLKQAALDDGLPEDEATARANAQLGDPVALAENAAALLRRSSWWGRHRIIGFCLVPPLAFAPLWICCAAALAGICRVLSWFYGPAYDFAARVASDDSQALAGLEAPLNGTLTFMTLLISGLAICWLIRRCAAGMNWMWIACAASSLTGLFMFVGIRPRAIFLGLTWFSPNWICAAVPLVVAAGAFLRRREMAGRLPPIPGGRRAKRRLETGGWIPPGRAACRTPTYWLIAIVTGMGLTLAAREKAREHELQTKIWPAERAATLAQLKARGSTNTAANAATISLVPWLNAALQDEVIGGTGGKENNLGELPSGVHIFGGIPFDVEGSIQLMGEPSARSQRRFPGSVDGIQIGNKCARIHLLHGASNLWASHNKVARLVLHYTDGSSAEIGIFGGEHLRDWWGPVFKTDAGDECDPVSPGSELAWTGGNAWIKKRAHNNSLRLYKSTLENPRPDLAITTLDYISTLGGPSPFMVGLTIEQPPHSSTIP